MTFFRQRILISTCSESDKGCSGKSSTIEAQKQQTNKTPFEYSVAPALQVMRIVVVVVVLDTKFNFTKILKV